MSAVQTPAEKIIYMTRSCMIVLLTKYHLGGHIKNYEMGGACGMYVNWRGTFRVLVGRPDVKRPLGRSECRRGYNRPNLKVGNTNSTQGI